MDEEESSEEESEEDLSGLSGRKVSFFIVNCFETFQVLQIFVLHHINFTDKKRKKETGQEENAKKRRRGFIF